ncbi:hypothetical protein PF005_g30232 [Phytophthora fragariae]|uniref:RxLR effector protein n=2 Tax=Phytophthora TaxID=4783 RepID=A0A6A3PJX1_9STRA|nr:hypothetical protein PF003_g24090 [Phytophthora fragariae]KAE9003288.1 hypothetical protein PR002_g17388 [Phytophthora rubi]KAE8919042.1 hypothetical protein PF009_g30644 [Phytophthora fragariae]KAE8962559.1 hypothetical protein PF011_g29337 [Phytophthora fragariae]KAE9006823.1 hypothetical protein PR001_g17112 [Phytophthora rubi]
MGDPLVCGLTLCLLCVGLSLRGGTEAGILKAGGNFFRDVLLSRLSSGVGRRERATMMQMCRHPEHGLSDGAG